MTQDVRYVGYVFVECPYLRGVSQQSPQRIRRQGLGAGELQCAGLLPVEGHVRAALIVPSELLPAAELQQVPGPHLAQHRPHRLHLPVGLVPWSPEEGDRGNEGRVRGVGVGDTDQERAQGVERVDL